MKVKSKSKKAVTVSGVELEEVTDFKYLGSYISADGNIEKEISTRIGLAAQAFIRLNNVWTNAVRCLRPWTSDPAAREGIAFLYVELLGLINVPEPRCCCWSNLTSGSQNHRG